MAKKKDEVPEDINKELESPKFGKPKSLTNSGYVLDINEKDKKVDLQLYESVQGTSIIEGLNLSKDVKLNDLQKINTLAMIAPITNEEKQKLLEAISLESKVKTLESIISFYLFETALNTQTIQ